MRINPFVRLVQPRAQVTFLSPARRARRGDLVRRMPSEIFAGRDERNVLLVVESLAREKIQKLRAFIPPVPEQFRVIRRDDERRTVQKSGELLDLRDALVEKMLRVFARGL